MYVCLLIKVVFVAVVQQFADLHACTYPSPTYSLIPRLYSVPRPSHICRVGLVMRLCITIKEATSGE